MKALIVGSGSHGKDTAAKWLCEDNPGLTASSSSWYCCLRFIFAHMRKPQHYANAYACYRDRRNHRAEWHQLIAEYNRDDPARLAREILAKHDLYIGMRAKREIVGCLEQELFDVIYWVDACQRLPPEGRDSMDFDLPWLVNCVERKCELIVLDNNGDRIQVGERYPA